MANATRKTVEVEKVIKTTEDVYVLELTKDEAEALLTLLGRHVIGTGPRRTLDGIWHALRDQDLDYGRARYLGTGKVNFQEYPPETDDRPIQVGDRVRIVRSEPPSLNGRTGVLVENDGTEIPYLVRTDGSRTEFWAYEVERVND